MLLTIRRKNTRYFAGYRFVSFLWLQFDPNHEILAMSNGCPVRNGHFRKSKIWKMHKGKGGLLWLV